MGDKKCLDHLHFAGGKCEDCGLEVNEYGNTEDQFDYCCFPNCGCDGSRLCMANNGASERALEQNVEGMWQGKTKKQREAVLKLAGSIQRAKEQGDG
jgi:hypothetical protein